MMSHSRRALRSTSRIAFVSVLAAQMALASAAQADLMPEGPEFKVTLPSADSGAPSTCATPDGGFVVVRRQMLPGETRILARRLDRNGDLVGVGHVASTLVDGDREDPDVACGDDGSFLVVWTDRLPRLDDPDDIRRNDVLARGFDRFGTAVSEPFLVNENTVGNQQMPAVCSLGAGRFAVIWQDRNRDELETRVVSTAGPLTPERQAANDPRSLVPPAVACTSVGTYLAAWGDFPSSSVNDEVVARRFRSDARALSPTFVVNASPTGDQGYPAVCTTPDDGFIVTWRDGSNREGGGGLIEAREISPLGVPIGLDIEITFEGRDRADVACGSDGGFVVTSSNGDDTLYAQAVGVRPVVDSVELPRELSGPELVVHRGATTLGIEPPAIAGGADERYSIVWPSIGRNDVTVRGRFFTTREIVVTTSSTTTTSTTVTTTTSTTTTSTTTTTVPLPFPEASCGNPFPPAAITVSDALIVLRSAAGQSQCLLCLCDVDGSGTVTAADALRVLAIALGLPRTLACPPCN